ncbi:DUF805 domain-containing protein [uncultured Cohaesibacter sp.]|uniref:DUF805 domain-containing protein n=1 Tax=uncultured Cohaesibacter sp. TaxID=1002546 RepID=UPI0029C86D01|nr:DUF805 domain-containing protein [uncultured Cohaesibacter sp.]
MKLLAVVRTILFKKYVQFHGRAPRHEFWWWFLAVIIANFVAVFIDMSILNSNVQMVAEPGRVEMSDEGPLAAILSLATLLPSLGVAVRRLHDVGKSGWWLLVLFVPLLGALYLIFLYVQRGTEGSNIYGPDPLEGDPLSGRATVPPAPEQEEEEDSWVSPEPPIPDTPPPSSRADRDPPRERPSYRPPQAKKGFQTTQERFRKK